MLTPWACSTTRCSIACSVSHHLAQFCQVCKTGSTGQRSSPVKTEQGEMKQNELRGNKLSNEYRTIYRVDGNGFRGNGVEFLGHCWVTVRQRVHLSICEVNKINGIGLFCEKISENVRNNWAAYQKHRRPECAMRQSEMRK